MHRFFLVILWLGLVICSGISQNDCDKLEIVSVSDNLDPDETDILLLLTVTENAPSFVNVSAGLVFVDEEGENVTIPLPPHQQLPSLPSDTMAYFMPLRSDLNEFPEDFMGVLEISQPDCEIPYTHNSDMTAAQTVNQSGFEIYPNPARHQLIVEGDGLEYINIFNNMGEPVIRNKGLGSRQLIDLQELPAGMYFVRLQGRNGMIGSEKIIVRD